MDFFQICTKETRGGVLEVYPDFIVGRSKDLMVRGQSFYAVWDEAKGVWSTDEYDVQRLVDEAVLEYAEKLKNDGIPCSVKLLSSYGTNLQNQFRKYLKNVSDNSHQLDMKLTFLNTEVKKTDYASRRLPYALAPGDHSAWDELTDLLYTPEERAKIEWTTGSIVAGDSKKIEKFLVFYGPGGTGKSTILKIVQKLFDGYVAMFEAKALVGNNNAFATEVFKNNPLVAIQHDGDLSKIEDNSVLNSIVGHDTMRINEKYKPGYESVINAMLLMGTNKPVKITDAKSGLIRRLIDVVPTGKKFDPNHYFSLMSRIDFELGAIAQHCLEVYRKMGKNYYNTYRPLEMMFQTDVFFNFIEAHYDIFKSQDGTSLKQAYALYKEYCAESSIDFKLPMYKFREELRNYFESYHDRIMIDGVYVRSYFQGFTAQPFKAPLSPDTKVLSLVMDETYSILDGLYADQPAQYGNAEEIPLKYWTDEERLIGGRMQKPKPSQVVSTTLSNLDTTKLHFVKVPENHIVIDFDLKGDDGEKSIERNLEAASAWPATYAELSKSGAGVHLHYTYDGDVSELAPTYSDGIEIKVYTGNSSLRRRLSKCNSLPVSAINGGLPFKEKKTMLEAKTLQSEKGLRDLIGRNLRKEIQPGTKPSMDFIKKILDDAYESGMTYDVTDLKPKIMAFANNSSNQALACLKIYKKMKFKSEMSVEDMAPEVKPKDDRLVFFDCEVYPNLFIICWKYHKSDTVVRMINPTPKEVEGLFQFKLVGYYNRDYDNHIMWARFLGYTNEQLYNLSQKITTNKDRNSMFGEAYNLSYADVFDFASEKKSLKKWEIELGLHHMEMDIPWDQPVPDEKIFDVVEYCCNDVIALEAVFEHRAQDFAARKILAELSGLSVNSTTRKHAERIIFGGDRNPQEKFVYTDLRKEFPGYVYDPYSTGDKSSYRGDSVGEGGYVYAEPGMYENVAVLDVASMHPTSIEQLDMFGSYTEKYSDLKEARLAIKSEDYTKAKGLLGGKLQKYIEDFSSSDESNLKALSDALKLVINSIYGYTCATFPNAFRDPRNVDNIAAKRGALFMIDLKNYVQGMGWTVAHIKTDSIKIPDATPKIIQFVVEFGRKYGYEFEHEDTYQKMCLVNDAVFIARKADGNWKAVGAQFQHPTVFKALFTGEPITFEDLCETKQVTGSSALYLDFNDSEATPATPYKGMQFVGKTGMFVPVKKEAGGAKLLRVKNDVPYAAAGTKGHLWLEADMVKALNLSAVDRLLFEDLTQSLQNSGAITDVIDMGYYETLAQDAIEAIEKFGSYSEFVR